MLGSQELRASLMLSVRTEDLHWACCFETSLQWQQLCLSPGKEICADTSMVWLEWSLTAPVVYFRKTNNVVVDFKLHSELIQYVIMNFLPDLRVIQQDLHLLWRSAAPLTALELYKGQEVCTAEQTSQHCTEQVPGAEFGQSSGVAKVGAQKAGNLLCRPRRTNSLFLQQQHLWRWNSPNLLGNAFHVLSQVILQT